MGRSPELPQFHLFLSFFYCMCVVHVRVGIASEPPDQRLELSECLLCSCGDFSACMRILVVCNLILVAVVVHVALLALRCFCCNFSV
jgi:hypothetical protein